MGPKAKYGHVMLQTFLESLEAPGMILALPRTGQLSLTRIIQGQKLGQYPLA